jgi:hypothetical protein
MLYKSKIAAITTSAVAAASFAFAPLVGEALPIQLTATVANTTVITSVTNATTTSYDGRALQNVPFTVTVQSNDVNGYTLQFAGTLATYLLTGVAHLHTITYTIMDSDTSAIYAINTINGTYVTPTTLTPVVHNFVMILPVGVLLPADVYSDTLTASVNPI